MTVRGSALRPAILRLLAGAARWLTTPLLPEDYLGLLNPLWSVGELRGRVEAVRPETADAATLVIRPSRNWVPHRPGQSVRIGVDIEGVRHWRPYSLSSVPGRSDGCITITVKAVPDGLVSRHLVRRMEPGIIVGLSMPEGGFVLPEPPPSRVLFLTAGSGITPVRAERAAWVCGPAEMLDEVTAHWVGLAERLHVESFRPAMTVADGIGGRVRFTKSGRVADADDGTPLLTVGEDAGVIMSSGCRMGICFSCVGGSPPGGYVTCAPAGPRRRRRPRPDLRIGRRRPSRDRALRG